MAQAGLGWADGGYNARQVKDAVAAVPILRMEIVKRTDDMKGVVAWLGRCRRVAKEWEQSIGSATAWALIASIRMLTRRIARY